MHARPIRAPTKLQVVITLWGWVCHFTEPIHNGGSGCWPTWYYRETCNPSLNWRFRGNELYHLMMAMDCKRLLWMGMNCFIIIEGELEGEE